MTLKLEVGRRYVDGWGCGELITKRNWKDHFISERGCYYTEEGLYVGPTTVNDERFNLIALAPDEGAPEPNELATLRAENAALIGVLKEARPYIAEMARERGDGVGDQASVVLDHLDTALAQKGERG